MKKAKIVCALGVFLIILSLCFFTSAAETLTDQGKLLMKYDLTGDKKISIADVAALLDYLASSCGHEAKPLPEQAAGCTTTGSTGGSYCAICNAVLEQPKELPATGHSYTGGVCVLCGYCPLKMALSADESYYIVNGMGDFTGTDLIIPSNYNGLPVKEIKYRAFNNKNLTSITIGDNLSTIGYDAFGILPELTSIAVSEKNTFFKAEGNCLIEIEKSTVIRGCASSVIPDGITRIEDNAFSASKLTTIHLPQSIKSIGGSAFYNCASLTEIVIPNGVTAISDGTFYGCSALQSATLPNTLLSIGNSAFNGCTSLSEIHMPASVTSCGNYAFYNCTALTGVWITDPAAWCGIDFNGSYASPLYYAHKLYVNNTLLKELIIPNTVTTIKSHTFEGCTELTKVVIPSSVTSIGNAAFHSCSSLEQVTIQDGVASIDAQAFFKCKSLTSIVIPQSVETVGQYVFNRCTNLSDIFCEASSIPSGWHAQWKDSGSVHWGGTWTYVDGVPTPIE